MSDWVFLAAVGCLILVVVGMHRRVPPDRCLVFFTKGPKPAVERITLSGLAFVPPWRTVKTLYLGAVTFTIGGDEIGASLEQPLRFLVGVENDRQRITEAAERLAGLDATALTELARKLTTGQLRDLRPETLRTQRTHFEAVLGEAVRMTLAAKGLKLLSMNLDGLFGDAPRAETGLSSL